LTDQQLLSDYATRREEGAFAELVQRHIDLVYSAALRMVRERHLAEDVTQGVFAALAQNARQLTGRPVLAGWLHRTAQNLAANVVRSDVRRRVREQEAAAMNELIATESDEVWEAIAPQLDAALGELNESDRDALMLRYFQRKSAREIAEILGVSDEAAQKRVNRAVERLRELFSKRGVAVGASGLAVVISANAVQAAPAGLAAMVSSAAVVAGTAAASSTVVAVSKTLAMTTLQKTLIAGTVAAAVSFGIYESHQAAQSREKLNLQRASAIGSPSNDTRATLHARIQLLESQNAELTQALAQANAAKAQLESSRQQAERSAKLYQELAHQNTKDIDSTNSYPSERHLFAGLGKIARISAQLKHEDESKLSAEEKSARDELKMSLVSDFMSMAKAWKQFEKDNPAKQSGMEPEDSDRGACLLYGALDLNQQQFDEAYRTLEKYRQARQQSLAANLPPDDAEPALKQLDEQIKTDLRKMMTAEQSAIFDQMLPDFQFPSGTNGGGGFHFNLNMSGGN
jgi:RNA polymerase sigma factor (sigma-70 family)